jgi:hypothetical protein
VQAIKLKPSPKGKFQAQINHSQPFMTLTELQIEEILRTIDLTSLKSQVLDLFQISPSLSADLTLREA